MLMDVGWKWVSLKAFLWTHWESKATNFIWYKPRLVKFFGKDGGLESSLVIPQVIIQVRATPWKFNIAPENIPSQKESNLPTVIFQGLCWTSRGYQQNNILQYISLWFFKKKGTPWNKPCAIHPGILAYKNSPKKLTWSELTSLDPLKSMGFWKHISLKFGAGCDTTLFPNKLEIPFHCSESCLASCIYL